MPFSPPEFFECGSEEKQVQENASIYQDEYDGVRQCPVDEHGLWRLIRVEPMGSAG